MHLPLMAWETYQGSVSSVNKFLTYQSLSLITTVQHHPRKGKINLMKEATGINDEPINGASANRLLLPALYEFILRAEPGFNDTGIGFSRNFGGIGMLGTFFILIKVFYTVKVIDR